MTAGGTQQEKAVGDRIQESHRTDGYKMADEKLLVTLKNRMVAATKELKTTAKEMAKESYVTSNEWIQSFDSTSNSSDKLVARKKRI